MDNFLISVEYACDLDQETIEKNHIQVAPMEFIVDGKTILSSDSSFSSHSYVKLLGAGANAKTSQINEFCAREYLENLLKSGKDIIHISFSSAMSNTFENFLKASESLNKTSPNKVLVVDSLCQSGGVGLLVKMLVDEINSGNIKNVDEAYEFCEKIKLNICHYFTVDNLKFLAKSGRLKTSTAFLGNLLQLKPILNVDDAGTMVLSKKVLGRKKAIKEIFEYMKKNYVPLSKHIIIIEADCENDAICLKQMIEQNFDVDVSVVPLNAVVSTHSGPGTLAVFFTINKR